MDKLGQDTGQKFEDGIFSGGTQQKEEQNLCMDQYFDYACQKLTGQQNTFCGPLPHGSLNKESRGREIEGNNLWRQEEGQERKESCSSYQERPAYKGNGQDSGMNGRHGQDGMQGCPGGKLPMGDWKCGQCGCMRCSNAHKTGHTMAEILALTAMIGLVVAFLAAVIGLVKISSWQAAQPVGKLDYKEMNPPYQEEDFSKNGQEEGYEEVPVPKPGNSGEYYGEITDAVRSDLEYSIEWENYEYEGNNDKVRIAVDYPVIKGDVPNLEAINDMIDDEAEYFEEYYKEYSKYMMPEEQFLVYSEGYVTFMDPEVMSVVFCEMIYTDYWTDYGLYCLNIDIENGVVLDNNSIMEINDEFAVDFRKRCRQQNGTVSDLDSMTDQEIVYYLTSGGTSILFYTPMGIEVGMNFGEYYVTVTYQDYEDFLQKY